MTGLLDIPDQVGAALGISAELAGLIISVGIIVSVAISLAMLKMNNIGILATLLCVLVLLVALQWTPYWVLIMVSILIAATWGTKMAGWWTGRTGEA